MSNEKQKTGVDYLVSRASDMSNTWLTVFLVLVGIFFIAPFIMRKLGANIHAFRYLVTAFKGT